MKWHEDCRYMELPRDYPVSELARFHGHLGPFIVLGYRMGRHALKKLGNNPFSLNAEIHCSGITPESCIVDGVQLGSGCTLGKGNIKIIISDQIIGIFSSDGQSIRIKPLPLQKLPDETQDYECAIENYAEKLYNLPDDQIFTVEAIR
jgi:formylmethanofuran dehydrogenase subunit E